MVERTSPDQLPVMCRILREGAGVDARVGRAYGVQDFLILARCSQGLLVRRVMGHQGLRMEAGSGLVMDIGFCYAQIRDIRRDAHCAADYNIHSVNNYLT
jgi:hypothetical protein